MSSPSTPTGYATSRFTTDPYKFMEDATRAISDLCSEKKTECEDENQEPEVLYVSPDAGPAPFQVWHTYPALDWGAIVPVNLAATAFSPGGPAELSPGSEPITPTGSEPIVCTTESDEEREGLVERSDCPSPATPVYPVEMLAPSTPTTPVYPVERDDSCPPTDGYDSCPPTQSPKLKEQARRSLFPEEKGAAKRSLFPEEKNARKRSLFPEEKNARKRSLFPEEKGAAKRSHGYNLRKPKPSVDFSRFVIMKNARVHSGKLSISKEGAQAVSRLLGHVMGKLAESAQAVCGGERMRSVEVQAALSGVLPAAMLPYAKRGGVRAVMRARK